jgi:hypothetical protein
MTHAIEVSIQKYFGPGTHAYENVPPPLHSSFSAPELEIKMKDPEHQKVFRETQAFPILFQITEKRDTKVKRVFPCQN